MMKKSRYMIKTVLPCLFPLLPFASEARASSSLEDELFGGGSQSSTPASSSASPASAAPVQPQATAVTTAEPKANETLTLGGRLELQSSMMKFADSTVGDSPLSHSASAELYLDSRPSDDLRGFIKGAITQSQSADANSTQSSSPKIELYEMWIKWSGQGALFTTVGRQKLKWGAASFWNPTDFLAVQTKDPLASFDVRPGANLIKLHVPVEKSGHNFYALVDLENAKQAHSPRAAARAEFNYGYGAFTGELTTTVVGGKDQPIRWGVDLSTALGPVDLIVESAWTRRSDQIFYSKSRTPEGTLNFSTVDRSKQSIAQVVVGTRYELKYSDKGSANLNLEYFWNDAGYSDVVLEAYSFGQGLVRGQNQSLYLANRYAAASLVVIPSNDFSVNPLVFTAITNLTDRSWLARTGYTRRISNRSRLEFALTKFGGLGEFRGGVPEGVVNQVKNAANLPSAVKDNLDRLAGREQDWAVSVSAGVDL
ncbi:MAG: hypothetical protein RI932_795 [Pseudomonadota bacterium]|jgi:hypothetical protein